MPVGLLKQQQGVNMSSFSIQQSNGYRFSTQDNFWSVSSQLLYSSKYRWNNTFIIRLPNSQVASCKFGHKGCPSVTICTSFIQYFSHPLTHRKRVYQIFSSSLLYSGPNILLSKMWQDYFTDMYWVDFWLIFTLCCFAKSRISHK